MEDLNYFREGDKVYKRKSPFYGRKAMLEQEQEELIQKDSKILEGRIEKTELGYAYYVRKKDSDESE